LKTKIHISILLLLTTVSLHASKGDSLKVVKHKADSAAANYRFILDDKICSDSVYVMVNVSLPKGKREPIQVGREGLLGNWGQRPSFFYENQCRIVRNGDGRQLKKIKLVH
jgi:hypothetical protein